MKIWIKYLIGCILGIVMALVFSFDSTQANEVLSFFTEISIRAGRYMVLPLVFFSMTVAVCKLYEAKKLLSTSLYIILISLFVTALFVIIGILSVIFVTLPRIPISVEKVSGTVSLNLIDNILKIFPYNGIGSLFDGAFLLPLYVLAGFAGAGFASDRTKSKAAFTVFDSLSKVSYQILCFFTDIIAVGMVAITCTWSINFFDIIISGTYNGLFILLLIDFIITATVILPLILRLTCKEMHPYKVLYASLTSIFAAFFSGDANFALPLNIRHLHESLGVRRSSGTITLPVFSTFLRAGSALTIVISFVVVLRSYSSLSISFFDICWIAVMGFLFSFCLGALPTGGSYVALILLFSSYGRGFEAGYLLLKPAAGIICSFAAAMDALVAMFCSYLIAYKQKLIVHKEIRYYI
ncbi:MAG: dicarboxylate/amino acid:cation symporter [Treponema sp. CETP13]|nr:MAG: dicarboxylate/amino acid:cation symporter [Treponema sp. CETP13]